MEGFLLRSLLTFYSLRVPEKSGQVKEDAFFTILNLHGIKLTDAENTKLKK